jgi:hypothetical protein
MRKRLNHAPAAGLLVANTNMSSLKRQYLRIPYSFNISGLIMFFS